MSPKGTDAFVRRAIRFLLSPAAQGVNEIIERGGGNLSINVASLSPLPNLAPSSSIVLHPRTRGGNEGTKVYPTGVSGGVYRPLISYRYDGPEGRSK